MPIDEHAEELASDLGVDTEEVKRDLENLLEYSVPVEEAKQSLRRKYGSGGDDAAPEPAPTAISDITTDNSAVTVTARVLTVGKRSIRYEGEEQVIHEGQLADETGRISYTVWTDFDFEPGDSITIRNANVREWEGNPELNLGESTRVDRSDDSVEVPYAVGGDAELASLAPGARGVNVDVRVIEVEDRTIEGRDGETEILSGVLADETARLPFTDWAPHAEIVEDATLRVENVYVREFRGVPSVNISEFSTIQRLERSVDPAAPTIVCVRDAIATGGAFDVEITGHVVGIRDGSGLIQRCPECGRVAQKGQCRSHGEVDAVDDLRVKAIVDDGTGAVTTVLDDELTADIYGGGVKEAREQARNAMDQGVVADTIRDRIVGREYRVRGSLSVDDFGATLTAAAFAPVSDDPAERAVALLEALE